MATFLAATLGFAPLILFWTLAGFHYEIFAAAAGLVGAIGLLIYRAREGRPTQLELIVCLVLLILAVGFVVVPTAIARHAIAASFALLGIGLLIGVILRRPWTSDYSRKAFAQMADDPLFAQINSTISAVWSVVFLLYAAGKQAGWPLSSLIGMTLLAKAISILGPGFMIRRNMAERIRDMESYHWPAPMLGSGTAGQGYNVAVVGSGIGGLTAAALLADAGAKVLVAEQHVVPGGFCHHWLRKQRHNGAPRLFRFDSGVHDFSGVWPGGTIDTLCRRLGLAIDWQRLDHSYLIDGQRLDVPRAVHDYVALLGQRFPASATGIATLFEEIRAVFDGMYATGEESGGFPLGPRNVKTMLAFPRTHPLAYAWMARPVAELVARHVQDERAIKFILALSGYLTHRPETLTVAEMAPLFGYYFHGGHYPVGGSGAFSQALAGAVLARGGRVSLKSEVCRILVENGAARGIELRGGERTRADAVISNADFRRTFLELIPPAVLPASFRTAVEQLRPTASALCVHLGLDIVPTCNPVLHFRHSGRDMGIVMPSLVDPSAAPQSYSTMELTRLLPPEEAEGWFRGDDVAAREIWRRSGAYRALKALAAEEMIDLASMAFPGLRNHLIYKSAASPVTFARYDWSSQGAIYGCEKQSLVKGAKGPVAGLYLAGAGNFGPGIEAVVIAGARAAEAILPGILARPNDAGTSLAA